MLPRVIALLLIPTLLLQGRCFAHSHAGVGNHESPDHGRTPHFHVPGAGTHFHHHDDGGHHHHDPNGHHHPHDDGDEAPEPASTPTPVNETPSDDHDSDAVFIDAVDAVASVRSQAVEEVVHLFWWMDGELLADAWADHSSVHLAINFHPPPLIDSFCPLYVQHRSLVI